MSLEDVLVMMAAAITIALIGMLFERFFQGKRFTIVRFCKYVIISMTGWFVLEFLDIFNWPKWLRITVLIVAFLAVYAVLDIVWKGKDNDESD